MFWLYYGGWGFMILSFIISIGAEIYVKSKFNKYSKIQNSRGLRGSDVASEILHNAGIYDVSLKRVGGSLTDYYSPSSKEIALSDDVGGASSIAAAGVAAHECGHAIQYAKGYFPIKIRNAIIPITQFGSKFWYISVILGLVFGNSHVGNAFLYFGIALFALICIFQFVTLPVEFNASHRALKILSDENILTRDEVSGAREVLVAAALTYVAALATSLLQLIRLLNIANGRKRD